MKKLMSVACLTGCLMVFMLLAGCATGPTQYVPLPEHLNEAPAPGNARVCVIRGFVFFIGSGVNNHIYEDNQFMGNLINGSYICWERPPGVVKLSMGDSDDIFYRGNLPVEADLVYYLYMDAVSPLVSITPAQGQKYLTEYPRPQVVASKQVPTHDVQAPVQAAPAGSQPNPIGAVPRTTGAGY